MFGCSIQASGVPPSVRTAAWYTPLPCRVHRPPQKPKDGISHLTTNACSTVEKTNERKSTRYSLLCYHGKRRIPFLLKRLLKWNHGVHVYQAIRQPVANIYDPETREALITQISDRFASVASHSHMCTSLRTSYGLSHSYEWHRISAEQGINGLLLVIWATGPRWSVHFKSDAMIIPVSLTMPTASTVNSPWSGKIVRYLVILDERWIVPWFPFASPNHNNSHIAVEVWSFCRHHRLRHCSGRKAGWFRAQSWIIYEMLEEEQLQHRHRAEVALGPKKDYRALLLVGTESSIDLCNCDVHSILVAVPAALLLKGMVENNSILHRLYNDFSAGIPNKFTISHLTYASFEHREVCSSHFDFSLFLL